MKLLTIAIGTLSMISGISLGITMRFMHPDKTETRLFIDHWPLILGCAVFVIAGSTLVRLGMSMKERS